MLKMLRALHRRLGLKYRLVRRMRYARRFGVMDALRVQRELWKGTGIRALTIPGVPNPVWVRQGTADASTFEHVFVWNDYDLEYPQGVRTVIDAGANIGLASVFFANRFPGALIIAIEPERENFELLLRNTAPYPTVVALHAALWSSETTVRLSNPGASVDSYRFDATGTCEAIPALTVASVLSRHHLDRCDLLKVDIEGAEAAVFAERAEWIDRVRMYVIELHGPEAEALFNEATAHLDASRSRHGENHIVRVNEG